LPSAAACRCRAAACRAAVACADDAGDTSLAHDAAAVSDDAAIGSKWNLRRSFSIRS